jgi:hypothetical protein
MTDGDNIIRLVQTTQRERVDVAAFLREWADAVENDGQTISVVLILHGSEGENLRVRTRRCNMDLLQTVGLLQIAMIDLAGTD